MTIEFGACASAGGAKVVLHLPGKQRQQHQKGHQPNRAREQECPHDPWAQPFATGAWVVARLCIKEVTVGRIQCMVTCTCRKWSRCWLVSPLIELRKHDQKNKGTSLQYCTRQKTSAWMSSKHNFSPMVRHWCELHSTHYMILSSCCNLPRTEAEGDFFPIWSKSPSRRVVEGEGGNLLALLSSHHKSPTCTWALCWHHHRKVAKLSLCLVSKHV